MVLVELLYQWPCLVELGVYDLDACFTGLQEVCENVCCSLLEIMCASMPLWLSLLFGLFRVVRLNGSLIL